MKEYPDPDNDPTKDPDKIPGDPVNDPANYRLGIFYYCREDKRLMPPKRFQGSGWEINFAHPKALLLIAGILAAALILSFICILIAGWLM